MSNRIAILITTLTFALLMGLVHPAQADVAKLTPRMVRALASTDAKVKSAAGTYGVWVRFTDRGLDAAALARALGAAEADLSNATRARRAKKGSGLVTVNDLPLNPEYLAAVEGTGATPRRLSRWLNSATFDATKDQVLAIAALPFVEEVELVARFAKYRAELSDEERTVLEQEMTAARTEKNDRWSLDYGGGAPAAELVNLPRAHDQGLTGEGVVIGMIDTGYDLDWHESMQDMDILATWDFINNREDVSDHPFKDPERQSWHGTECLSVLGAYSEGEMVGVAWKASYVLAKTEQIDIEDEMEEDAWIEALEWMEGIGVDIVSSGIGYFDWYTDEDLDGVSAPITLAADMAVSRGVVMVVASGDFHDAVGMPRMGPPADGRKVITVGSADLNGYPLSNSSSGPTWDGRIKPDVLGSGYGILASSWWVDNAYSLVTGSSFATAQIAGVAALMLEQNPDLTPLQVREALRMTASRSTWPDNDFGWGVVDAQAAVNYWGPTIVHTPHPNTDNYTDPVVIEADITSAFGVNDDDVTVSWRVSFQEWHRAGMTRVEGDRFRGEIPPMNPGTLVQYYIEASDGSGTTLSHPVGAPDALHLMVAGTDAQAPMIQHYYLPDILPGEWPPTVRAEVSDDRGVESVELTFQVNGSSEQGPYAMTEGDYGYETTFPTEAVVAGDRISYSITARDVSNSARETTVGPFEFLVVAHRGKVILVDDSNSAKSYEGELPASDHVGGPGLTGRDKSAPEDIESYLLEMGYDLTVIKSTDVKKGSFNGFDVVVLSSGSTYFPLLSEELRNQLLLWSRAGGKLLIEGGETAYAAFNGSGSVEFTEEVLHCAEYWGEGAYSVFQNHTQEDHALSNRPNPMPNTLEYEVPMGGTVYVASDMVQPTEDAVSLYSTSLGDFTGGPVAYDNNTGADGGQMVFYPFSFDFVKPSMGRWLIENAMTYLLVREPMGPSSVTGRVVLAGAEDFSGVTVTVDSLHTAVTASDGSYMIEGLWGGDYSLTASLDGYSPRGLAFHVEEGQSAALEDITLSPMTLVEVASYNPVSIPDNDPVGITESLAVDHVGTIQGISVWVDISHYSINNLIIRLVGPTGIEVTLQNRTGGTVDDIVGSWPDELTVDGPGSMADFLDQEVQGTWQLFVSDNQFGATGTLNSWGLSIRVADSIPAGVKKPGPEVTRILGNSPNPFNPRTVISFELAQPGKVRLDVFDIRGRRVRNLVDGDLSAGTHQVLWDGLDQEGRASATGMYFTKLHSGGQIQVEKMLLLR